MTDEQYSKLPNLFQEIIRFDKRMRKLIQGKVVSLKDYKQLSKERTNLSLGARNFLKRQGGGGGYLG